MVNEDAALLNRRVTHMTPAALFSRRLHHHASRFARQLQSALQSGCGATEKRSVVWASVCVHQWTAEPGQGALLGRVWSMGLREAIGTRTIHLASE